jgi:uncharacterized protein (DUF2252 family)
MATQVVKPSSIGETTSAQPRDGKNRRQTVPRSTHAAWSPVPNRVDPVAIIKEQDADRLPELVPIRHERMSHSPFAFYRGAAAVMAADLSSTPTSGSLVQACGDSHLSNFGAFATPERNLIFDVNDFDETLRAPWEWDVKRLAASVVLAARELDIGEKRSHKAASSTVRSYREWIRSYADMSALDLWYSRIDAAELVERMQDAAICRDISKEEQLAHHHTLEHISPHLVADESGIHSIVDDVPLVFHFISDSKFEEDLRASLKNYEESLRDDVRMLYGRYRQVDLAMKVVGVGSVGTRCAIALFQAGAEDLLMLQIKEATTSVLERYAGANGSGYKNQGERCVMGQRLMQAASDLFLGWTAVDGRDFYIRQLRDMKAGVDLTRMNETDLVNYATLCGKVLARAHARTGDARFIADYLGNSDSFDEALADFAQAYADQTEHDFDTFLDAIKSGQLLVLR